MKRSNHLNTPSISSRAYATVLSATVIAGSLLACSSGSSRAGYETTSTDSTDPGKPGASDPSASGSEQGGPGSDGGAAAEDCKTAPPTNMCGVSPQCGCAAGKTCDVVSTGGSARCVSAGTKPMGHPCSATAECAVGMTCVFGTCHAFCSKDGEQCSQPGTGACTQVKTTEGKDVPNLAVCRVACEPYDPGTCGGAVCIIDGDGNTECQSGGSRAEGETCSPEEECGPGLGCVTTEDKSTCRRWCRLGENDCGGDKVCTGFDPEIVVRDTAYGSCN